ncbi:MAG TPA: signal peptidase II [Candidatus Caccovivens faecavium]|nr:signal peptidase II [Candidatus Caccovivens faecavium]
MKKSLINKIIVLSVLIVVVLALDLVTKYVFDGMYAEGTGVSLGIFNLIIVHNHGAAWGIFSGNQVGLVILSLVFLAIFIWFYVKDKNKSWLLTITFAFLCAGCIGNLYDRLVFGYVRDFIQFAFWQSFPVFNFADVFLTVGVVMFIIYLLIYAFKKEKKPAVVDTVGKIVIEEQLDKDEEDDEIRKQVIKNNEFKKHNNIEEDKTDDKNE